MKINHKIFSLPPYISTTWSQVNALHMKGNSLIVSLMEGETVTIPNLQEELLESIFTAHTAFLEEKTKEKAKPSKGTLFSFLAPQGEAHPFDFPLKFGIGNMENWITALQHNPAQANFPPLPEEVLDKVRSIAKLIAPEDPIAAPKPEPHCHCMYCQIARAIHQGLGLTDIYGKDNEYVEEVADHELSFQQWDIEQQNEKLYKVTNRLDHKEHYNVYLGQPVGCTCGKQGCEHILAVLKS